MQRSFMRTFSGIAFMLILLGGGVLHPAVAADFDVACNTTDLVTAITTANGNAEADTINLAAGCTYSFTVGDATFSDNALPRITSTITINGNGATLERAAGAATEFRLIFVAFGSTLTLNDITLTGGSAGQGGAIYIENTAVLDATGITITNSSATAAWPNGSGGAIYSATATLTLRDSTLSGNDVTSEGGAIRSTSGSTTITGSTISGNVSTNGGGIHVSAGFLTVVNSSVTGNTAATGGGLYSFSTVVKLVNTRLSGNSATSGGGIYNLGNLTLVNVLLTGNSATGLGGGISNPGTATLTNTTIAGNSAATGGGIYHELSTMTVANSIIWGNSTQIFVNSGTFNMTYSSTEGSIFSGTGNVSSDPAFLSPVAHTLAPTTAGDYHLQVTSLVIDKGSDAALPADEFDLDADANTAEALPVDFEGDARVTDIIVSTDNVDMGADEYDVCVPYVSPYTVAAGDTADLILAVTCANRKPDANVINLTNSTYNFTVGDATNSDSALPRITSLITLDGNGATLQRDSGSPSFRLLRVANTGNLTLDDVIATGGSLNNTGGGILNGGTLVVVNSIIAGNSANFGGGGIYNSATLTVTNSTVSGNSSSTSGGGIYNHNSTTLTVVNSTIAGNSAPSAGGLHNSGALTVANSTLSANSTVGNGGGILNTLGGTLTVIKSALSGNSAGGNGGGFFNDGAALTVTNSTLSGNSAGSNGGGIYGSTTLNVINTQITGNSAGGNGGGVFQDSGSVTVSSSTISGNSAAGGGGLYFVSATATVTNSIVWGNSSQIGGASVPVVTFSTVEGGSSGTGNLNVDPLFVFAPPYAAAPTSAGDFHLQYGSPAINVGSNAALPADTYDLDGDSNTAEPLPVDLGGGARVMAGLVDMGSYEFEQYALLTNGGFETDANADKVPDGWTLVNKTGDKLLCDPAKAHSGNCAFKFKGGMPETAQLSQVADLTGLTFSAGDTLSLNAWFKGASTAAKTKFVLSVIYTGNPTPVKIKLTVKQHAAYTQRVVPDYALTAGGIDQIKVVFQHKSASGSVFVDDANLLFTPGNGPRGSRLEGVLPPPAAPSGFRGGN